LVRNVIGGVAAALLAVLCGCVPDYSPNTYESAAVQQANPTQRGVVVGLRQVGVSADATLGTVTGAAAGGIAGAGVDGGAGPVTALSALGGSVIGGVVGSGVEHATGDTKAYEYIVQETKGDLVSVTQRDAVPLAIGQKVLVITGKQARVVADYTVTLPEPAPKAADKDKPAAPSGPPGAAPSATASTAAPPPAPAGSPPATASVVSPIPPAAGAQVPTVSAPVAAALDGSPTAAAPSPTTAAASSTVPPSGASAVATQPGAPVSLAPPMPVGPAAGSNAMTSPLTSAAKP
jgi:outer membrane lipoprotein SlyB